MPIPSGMPWRRCTTASGTTQRPRSGRSRCAAVDAPEDGPSRGLDCLVEHLHPDAASAEAVEDELTARKVVPRCSTVAFGCASRQPNGISALDVAGIVTEEFPFSTPKVVSSRGSQGWRPRGTSAEAIRAVARELFTEQPDQHVFGG